MTTATDHDALLAAVLAEPDEDGPRLVLADWLEENGQPERSAFIRVQCELAAWKPYRAPPELDEIAASGRLYSEAAARMIAERAEAHEERRDALRRRERELLRHWRDWAGPAFALVPEGALFDDHLTFRRGFVEVVRCTLTDWLTHGPAIVRCQPVTRVECGDREPDCARGIYRHPVYAWYWDGATPRHVPADVYDLLPLGDVPGFSSHTIYSAREKARDALSVALLAWAKS